MPKADHRSCRVSFRHFFFWAYWICQRASLDSSWLHSSCICWLYKHPTSCWFSKFTWLHLCLSVWTTRAHKFATGKYASLLSPRLQNQEVVWQCSCVKIGCVWCHGGCCYCWFGRYQSCQSCVSLFFFSFFLSFQFFKFSQFLFRLFTCTL